MPDRDLRANRKCRSRFANSAFAAEGLSGCGQGSDPALNQRFVDAPDPRQLADA